MANLDNTPQNGSGGSSYIYDMGMSPNTRAVVSQKVRILTPHYGAQGTHQMGVISTFNPQQSRSIEAQRGVGFGDKIAELVPSVTEPMALSFERVLLYLSNLWQATGYAAGVDGPVRSLAHHKWPFDVEQQMVFSTLADMDLGAANTGLGGTSGTFQGGIKQIKFPTTTEGPTGTRSDNGHSAIITMYEACWFSDWSTSFSRDTGVVMESGSATCTDVHDFASIYGEFLATGNDPTLGQQGSIRFVEADAQAAFALAGQGVGVTPRAWQQVNG